MQKDGHRRLESELRQHETPAFLCHFSVPERKIATITFLAASLKNLIRIYKPISFANQFFLPRNSDTSTGQIYKVVNSYFWFL